LKVILGLTAKPGKAAELRSILLELAAQSRNEAGCVGYEVLQNTADPSNFALVEEWTTEAALDAHLKMQHVQDAFLKGIPLLAKEPDNRRYSVVK
jgi:quinol monooxygenase YgiN